MNEPRQCPQCGAALPGDVLEGLCPQCMARVVFGEDHAATGEPEGKAAATIRVDPDSDATIERPGTIIGRYKLLEPIGEGGFGVVYLAEQIEPVRRKVALKVVKAGMDTKEVIARFEAERQALALMDHPNIAKILDAGVTGTPHPVSDHPLPVGRGEGQGEGAAGHPRPLDGRGAGGEGFSAGRPYFVMELVKGIPITEFCDLKTLAPAERLELFVKVCSAVQHAHQKGIIHRDIKPSNVLVTLHDGEPVPKVIDFGIAKALGPKLTEKTLFTGFAHLLGTPAYMSPEQAELSGLDIDTRADIYSLGVLLYELLTGVTPFDKETLAQAALDEVRRMIRETEPPKPSTRLRGLGNKLTEVANHRHVEPPKLVHVVRGDLDWIVMKCLEKDRRRRYETANGLAMDLQRHLHDEPVVACPPSAGYRLQKFIQRNRIAVAAASGFIFLLTAAAVVSTALAVWAKASERKALDAEADAKAVLQFFNEKVLAAARPAGQVGGLGHDVTIRAAVDAAEPLIAQTFTNRPLVEAAIHEVIGTTYHHLGDAERAAAQHRRALELRRPVLGLEHLDTVSVLVWLAEDLRLAGQTAEAIPLLEEALKVGEKLWGVSNTNTFSVMNNLGLSYFEAGRTKESLVLLEKTKDLRIKYLGFQHPDTVVSLVNLGDKYRALGRGVEAVPLLEQAVAVAGTNLSPHDPDTLVMMNNLALAYSAVGKLKRAAEVQQEVLEQRRALLPPDHQYLLVSSNNVALAWRGLGRFAEALQLLEQTAERGRELWGTNLVVITLFNNVALVAEDLGETNRALRLFQETFIQRRKLLGPDHRATLRAMNYWARALMRSGQLDDAEQLLIEAERRWRATESWNVDTAALTLGNLAHCLLLKGDAAGAETRAREYAALTETSSPHPWCKAEASGLLGAALLAQKQVAAAETNLFAAFTELQANYPRMPAHTGPRLRQSIDQWLLQFQKVTGRSGLAEQWRQRLKGQ